MIAYRQSVIEDLELLNSLLHELDAQFPTPLSQKTRLSCLVDNCGFNGIISSSGFIASFEKEAA